jgi:hypothetical protein
MGAANRRRVHEDASGVRQAHSGGKVATVRASEGLSVEPKLNSRQVASTTSTGKGPINRKEQLVLEKERKCKYYNTNAIIGLLMCTAAWINVKVSPFIPATSTSEKCKGDRKRRPRVQTQVNGTPIEALIDSVALVSVMSQRAFKTVWEHWNMQRLPIPAALNVSGVNGKKIDVTGYVKIPLTIKDEKTTRSGPSRGQSWCSRASDRLTSFSAMISSKRKE